MKPVVESEFNEQACKTAHVGKTTQTHFVDDASNIFRFSALFVPPCICNTSYTSTFSQRGPPKVTGLHKIKNLTHKVGIENLSLYRKNLLLP